MLTDSDDPNDVRFRTTSSDQEAAAAIILPSRLLASLTTNQPPFSLAVVTARDRTNYGTTRNAVTTCCEVVPRSTVIWMA